MSFVEDEKILPCEVSRDRRVKLGKGAYGSVFASNDDVSALKIVNYIKPTDRDKFLYEAFLTVQADEKGYGPTNVKYGECSEEKYGFILMKKGTPLIEILRVFKTSPKCTEQAPLVWPISFSKIYMDDAIPLMWPAILNSLSKMHKDGIFHQDTHTGNFLYYPDTRKIRIIDYGFAIQCGRDITGTVAAAYDIMKIALQLIGLGFEPMREEITPKRLSLLTRLLDKYWDQEAFEFVRESVFKFTRVKGEVHSTNHKPPKLQPSNVTMITSYARSGVISFIRKLFEQIPAIKPNAKDFNRVLMHELNVAMYLHPVLTAADIYDQPLPDVVMKKETEGRHNCRWQVDRHSILAKIHPKIFDRVVEITLQAESKHYGPMGVRYGKDEGEKYGFITVHAGLRLSYIRDPRRYWEDALKVMQLMHKDGIFHQHTFIGNFIDYGKHGLRILDYNYAIQCGRDITGTVAAAYDIVNAAMQFAGIHLAEGVVFDRNTNERLDSLLSQVNNENIDFVKRTVLQIRQHPNKQFILHATGVNELMTFVDRLFKQIPTIKPKMDFKTFAYARLVVGIIVRQWQENK